MSVEQAFNFRRVDERVSTAGIVTEEQLQCLAGEGYQAVINLLPDDSQYAVASEQHIVEEQGLRYHYIPVDFTEPTTADFAAFEQAMGELADQKIMIHCAANYRVSAFYSLYACRHLQWSEQRAAEWVVSLWNPDEHPPWSEFIAGHFT